MNKEEFYNWFDTKFLPRTSGGIIVDNDWYDRVENAHIDIRKKLGGVRKIQKIELDNIDPVCKWSDIAYYAIPLYTLIPDYFSKYQIAIGDMIRPTIPKDKKPKGCKFGKHISTWITRYKKEIRGTEKDKNINDLLCKIGGIWSSVKSRKDVLYVNISTSPVAFSYIGSYGPDAQSCFRQAAQNHHHKFILGQTAHTFVIVISGKDQEETSESVDNIARLWGICNSDMTEIIISNRYIFSSYSQHGNINKAIELAFSNITGFKYNTTNNVKNLLRMDGVYQNADTYVLSTSVNKDIKEKRISFNVNNFTSFAKCSKDNYTGQTGVAVINVDGRYYCRACMKKMQAKFCQHSKIWTMGEVAEVFDIKYNKITVSTRLLDDIYIKCTKTNEWHDISNIVYVKNAAVSRRYLESSSIIQCPYCSKYDEKELFSINSDILEDIPVCTECAKITKSSKRPYNVWKEYEDSDLERV